MQEVDAALRAPHPQPDRRRDRRRVVVTIAPSRPRRASVVRAMLVVSTGSRGLYTALEEGEEQMVLEGLRDPQRPRIVAVGQGAVVDLVRLVYRTEAGSSFPVRLSLLTNDDDEGTRELWEASRPTRSRAAAARAAATATAATAATASPFSSVSLASRLSRTRRGAAPVPPDATRAAAAASTVAFAHDDVLSRAIEAWRAACGDAVEHRSVFTWHSETRGQRQVVLHAEGAMPPHVVDEATGKCWLIRPRARPRDEADEDSDDDEDSGEEVDEEVDDEVGDAADGEGEGGASGGHWSGGARLSCPITLRRFRDPVRAPDGHVYERRALRRWLTRHRQTSPMTNLHMQVVDVDALPTDDEVMRRIEASRARRRLARQAQEEWERGEQERAVLRYPRRRSARWKAPWSAATALYGRRG